MRLTRSARRDCFPVSTIRQQLLVELLTSAVPAATAAMATKPLYLHLQSVSLMRDRRWLEKEGRRLRPPKSQADAL